MAKSLKPKIEAKPKRFSDNVRRFLENEVLDGILDKNSDGHGCVMVNLPGFAYENKPEFYRLCDKALKPLGYSTEASWDGGGVNDTLIVTWSDKL